LPDVQPPVIGEATIENRLGWRITPTWQTLRRPRRVPVALGVLFCVGFAILGVRVLRRGSMDLKSDTSFLIGMTWGFVVLTVAMFMVMSLLVPDRIVGLWLSVFGVVVLVIGAVFLIRHGIAQSELRTREKLLEIEYRLAELVEMGKVGKTKP
jgi:hypothetical protein